MSELVNLTGNDGYANAVIINKCTLSNVKFLLYLKKAGLASRNIVYILKNNPTLYRFLLLYSSFSM